MKAREFCYWLQGHIELSGSAHFLDVRQIQTIGRHLDMVAIHDGQGAGMASGFCSWLSGIVQAHQLAEIETSHKTLDSIKARLSNVFLHEIDRSYPKEQQAALNEAHRPPTPPKRPNNGFEAMC